MLIRHMERESGASRRAYTAKLNPYDGVTEPLETFLAKFENYSASHRWGEEEQLFNLRNSLDKEVGNVLRDSGSPASSSELIALLWSRYGNENQAERFWMELKTRRRRKGSPGNLSSKTSKD